MAQIFAPVVSDVLRLVSQQVNNALEARKKRINVSEPRVFGLAKANNNNS